MPVKLFFCYAHEDEPLLNKLKTQLSPLGRQRLIEMWHDRDISAGTEWEEEINQQLNTAQIILLLVSPDFMDSDYCYSIEMQRVMERHDLGEAQVIPIILCPVYWQDVLGKLQALPKDGLPITDPDWHNIDRALYNVTEGIRNVAVKVMSSLTSSSQTLSIEPSKPEPTETAANVLKQQTKKSEPLITPEDFSWQCIRTLTEHESYVSSVAISADGQTLASGSYDKTINLWNVKTGDLLRTLTGHEYRVSSVAISANGQTLVSGSVDDKINLWNVKTGDLLHTLTGDENFVYSVAFSPDGQTLASGSEDTTIRVWEKK
jgi:hypothetical protein